MGGRERSYSRNEAAESLVASFVGEADAQSRSAANNVKVLGLTAFLFMVITTAQTFAGIAANSQALISDCISMGVDSGTYFLNMLVECTKGKVIYRPLQLTVPVISIGVLVTLNFFAAQEAIGTIPLLCNHTPQWLSGTDSCAGEDADDVNPWIVFIFAVWGVIFDLISIWAFRRNVKKGAGVEGASVNMMTAFAHVGADFVRSTSTFISSLLMFAGANTTQSDAWAAIVICVTIYAGAVFMAYEWAVDVLKYCRGQEGAGPATDV